MSIDSTVVAKSLLLVDDDKDFCNVLGASLRRRGIRVSLAHDLETALSKFTEELPDIAILDLNLNGYSSLPLIPSFQRRRHDTQILMLTGYASIVTAVEATKLGVKAYMTKPANIDDILHVLKEELMLPIPSPRPSPAAIDKAMQKRFRLVIRECAGNISAAARKLGMHRRSLQRKLKRDVTH